MSLIRTADRVDEVLAPYEMRPVTTSRDEILRRKSGTSLGQELNRLQGIIGSDIDDRLARLWVHGQVSMDEYVDLCKRVIVAMRGEPRTVSGNGR